MAISNSTTAAGLTERQAPASARVDPAPGCASSVRPWAVSAADRAVASERWVVAQQAISRLVATRAPLTAALADIDRLYLDRSVEEQVDGLPDIYALRDRLADLVSGQDAVIEALGAQLPGQ